MADPRTNPNLAENAHDMDGDEDDDDNTTNTVISLDKSFSSFSSIR